MRKAFYNAIHRSWEMHINHEPFSDSYTEEISTKYKKAVGVALKGAQSLFPFLGMQAIMETSSINQIYRDLHTAGQHSMLTPFYQLSDS